MMIPLSNKKRITFAPRRPANHLHLQVGKRESLNRLRGDSHSRDALPVGSESHDYLCYFIVQCVSDIQLSNLPAGFQPARDTASRANEVMVGGGAEIYAQALPVADRLYITHVGANPEGDSYFPPVDMALWRESGVINVPPNPNDSAAFRIKVYRRAPNSRR